MRVLLAMLTRKHHKIANRLLELKKTCPNLRVELVIDKRQKFLYLYGTNSVTGLERNRLIDASDEVHLINERQPEPAFMQMRYFFAQYADTVLYASHAEMEYACEKADAYARQHRALLWEPKHSNMWTSHATYLFQESIDFLRQRQFRVFSNDIPDDLLKAWMTPDVKEVSQQIGIKGLRADLMRLLTLQCQQLPLAVFVYAFSFYDSLYSWGDSRYHTIRRSFEEFQKTLQREAAARKKRCHHAHEDVPAFDCFDGPMQALFPPIAQ